VVRLLLFEMHITIIALGLPVAPPVADPLDQAAPRRPGLASRSNVTVATITLTTLTAIDVVVSEKGNDSRMSRPP
jgi:hypothetical protein